MDPLERARNILREARAVAVLTGAGISAESGIPTFRDGLTGLWKRFRPEELATAEAFLGDPPLVWEWYAWRRERVEEAQPNPGHHALVDLEKRCGEFTLITQNVDGLHTTAGSRNVIELHGNIRRVKCFDHGHAAERWSDASGVPRCQCCGSLLRPDVVWFGEMLPAAALEAAHEATRKCDVFLSIGTSTLVEPAASLPFLALERGAAVIEVNAQLTPLSARATAVLTGSAGTVLPQLVA